MTDIRFDWTLAELSSIYEQPLIDLIYQAATVHRRYHNPKEVQMSTLLSIKTGGCPEDCAYCPQAARYQTDITIERLLDVDEVIGKARQAKAAGSSRFCLGAAWREVRDNRDFDRVIEMVKGVNDLGMEVCCTLGMITEDQAKRLKDAGVYAYNHNLDTSPEFYREIISTRMYEDRLDTLDNVRKAGLTVCCGGIIGMGESQNDRLQMLLTIANLQPHPESVPINALVPVDGTPLAEREKIDTWEMVRMIATARIVLPGSLIRLSAGRTDMSPAEQALCFLAGAGSIFTGEKLLTTPNPGINEDRQLFDILGLRPREAFKETEI